MVDVKEILNKPTIRFHISDIVLLRYYIPYSLSFVINRVFSIVLPFTYKMRFF